MAIMPEADSTAIPPPDVFLSRMARLDGCPDACGNTEAPYKVTPELNGSFTAAYGCETCGQFWTTTWSDR